MFKSLITELVEYVQLVPTRGGSRGSGGQPPLYILLVIILLYINCQFLSWRIRRTTNKKV